MLVQAGSCRACLETTLLVFPRGDSNKSIPNHSKKESGLSHLLMIGKSIRHILFNFCSRGNLPFQSTHHLENPWNENKRVQISRDGQVNSTKTHTGNIQHFHAPNFEGAYWFVSVRPVQSVRASSAKVTLKLGQEPLALGS